MEKPCSMPLVITVILFVAVVVASIIFYVALPRDIDDKIVCKSLKGEWVVTEYGKGVCIFGK
jgi:hypothetical protein